MEQARYWMWAKRKPHMINPRILAPAAMGDSWEEQAFAEDAAGSLGGCVWPPRSYSCSFCRREFRSAQALGGHMNVHRRDRARLKQSPIPQNNEAEVVAPIHALNACTSLDTTDTPSSSEMSTTILYRNSNPNQFSDPLLVTRSPVIRVFSPDSAKVAKREEKKMSSLSFSFPQENYNKNSVVSLPSPPPSDKKDLGPMVLCANEEEKIKVVRSEREDRLPVNMNLVVCRIQTNEEQIASCKRRRIEAKPLSFFPKLSSADRCFPQSEELDLELRLGDAPKVR